VWTVGAWILGIAGVLGGAGLFVISLQLLRDPNKDTSLSAVYQYIGTAIGIPAFVLVFFQAAAVLRRRGGRTDPLAQLRSKIREDLQRRLQVMRLAGEDIDLRFARDGSGQGVPLDKAGRAETLSSRVVLVGPAGCGKSYSALQIALSILRLHHDRLPVVVPLSRWTEGSDLRAWSIEFLEREFNLSPASTADLLDEGKFVLILDGLDETCRDLSSVEPAVDFLKSALSWRVLDQAAPFFLTCRLDVWERLSERQRQHRTLEVFHVRAVGTAQARRFMARVVEDQDNAPFTDTVVEELQEAGMEALLTSPWQITMASIVLKRHTDASGQEAGSVIPALTPVALVAEFVQATALGASNRLWRRILTSVDLWWLAGYARYLVRNRREDRSLDGVELPTRDLELHRLWPVAGSRAPRAVDFALAAGLSIPGFVWAYSYLWDRGTLVRLSLMLVTLLWLALMVRTTTKAWVKPATQDFARLRQRPFVVRQTVVSTALGLLAGAVFGLGVGALVFVSAWLAIGLTVGFGQTLAADSQARVVGPLGVLLRERRVSRMAAWAVMPLLAVGFSATWGGWWGTAIAAVYCFVVGETVACALWRRYLAMNIASALRFPPSPARSLGRLHRLGMVRVAGLSYQCRDDDLLEHFANRKEGPLALLWERRTTASAEGRG
jgi:hypothetical protein